MIRQFLTGAIAVVALAVGVNMVFLSQGVGAQTIGNGFFTGRSMSGTLEPISECGMSGQRWHYVICGGVPNYAGNKEGFIGYIEGKLASGSEHDRTGAAFIVFTMLGRSSSSSRTPSSSEMDDWRTRLRAPEVTIENYTITASPNTVYGRFTSDNVSDIGYVSESRTAESLVFKHNGTDVYYIKRDCANPLGRLGGLPSIPPPPPPPVWSVSGDSKISLNNSSWVQDLHNVTPGQRLYWRHTLRNNGPDNMDRSVSYGVQPGNTPSGSWQGNNGSTHVQPGPQHVVTQDDVGNTVCQHISWTPGSTSNSGTASSAQACAHVPYNYTLTPQINVPIEAIAEGTEAIDDITASIDHTGPTKSKPVRYAVIRFVIRDGGPALSLSSGNGVNGGSDWACASASAIGTRHGVGVDLATCTGSELVANTGVEILGRLDLPLPQSNNIASMDVSVGDYICYTTVVSAYSQDVDDNTFAYAEPGCVRVAKKPKVQIWGGDVRSNSLMRTSNTQRNSMYYGSWAEYGIFGGGTSDVVSASGAGLSAASTGRSGVSGPASYNQLTFSNTSAPLSFGRFGTIPPTVVPVSFDSSAGATHVGGSTDIGGLVGSEQLSRWQASDLTISGGTVPAGRSIVVKSTGTVTISGNIDYADDTVGSISDLPQLIIIAHNIIINDNVTSVHGWLISQGGHISTCGPIPAGGWLSGLDTTTCDQQLRIVGPVVTDRLFLRRTAGATRDNPGLPAEIINLRPDTYLWANGNSRDSGSIRTMYIRELPPRF